MEPEMTVREVGIKKAVQSALAQAVEAYKLAAIVRASMNPEIQALSPLYEQIGETWEYHAWRTMKDSPKARKARKTEPTAPRSEAPSTEATKSEPGI